MKPGARLPMLLHALLHEGPRAVADRLVDLAAERRWLRSFARLPVADQASLHTGGSDPRLVGPPALKVLATPLSPRFGGVPTQLLHRFRHEERLAGAALLSPVSSGDVLRLAVGHEGRRRAVEWRCPGASLDEALVEAAALACRWLGTDIVHIENLAPLHPQVALRLAEHGLRLVLSFHDFFAFCRRPHLLEEPDKRFCAYCKDPPRCARCLLAGTAVDLGEDATSSQAHWRRAAACLAGVGQALLFPSRFLRDRLAGLLGQPADDRLHVIPPGTPEPGSLPARRPPTRRLRLGFVGGAKPHKGSRVLVELLLRLQEAGAEDAYDLVIFGGGEPQELSALRAFPRVEVRGYYRGGHLAHLLRRYGIELALLLSPVPESFGLTLDECRWAGVPGVAFDHGALGDRIRQDGGGLLVEPQAGAAGLLRLLLPLLADRSPLAELAVPRPRDDSVAEAARRHLEVYRSLGAPR